MNSSSRTSTYRERPLLAPLAAAMVLCLASAQGPAASGAGAAPDFLERVETALDFDSIAVESVAPLSDRLTKFLLPARDAPELLPALFQNTRIYRLHVEFLSLVFPGRFPGLTFEEYLNLVERRATREYYAGTITRHTGPGPVSYGFTIFTDGRDPAELLEVEEILEIYQRLRVIFAPRPLEYAPLRPAEILKAQTWKNPGFPIRFADSGREVIGYSSAVNYGRVRILTAHELAEAEVAGELDWRTIVVVDEAPTDIEGVVAGVVTGSEQGELGHLAIRLARRGAPNVFVSDARNAFQGLDGEIVRLEVNADSYSVREAPIEEAETWWTSHRPSVRPLPEIDASYAELDSLTGMDVGTARRAIARFGGKASNLAILYRHLPSAHQVPGFAIPFRYYQEFMRSNTIPSLDDPATEDSYEQHLLDLLEDERFRAGGAFRRSALKRLRDHAREHGVVTEELLRKIRGRLVEVFGDPAPKVRFRSSSNAEDSVEFAGAGLYDSTSLCMDDELDGDERGPSRCDVSKSKERTIARGLRKVWMSLWNDRAFDERDYFQIDHHRVAMGILVTLAFPDEDANGVAFTGNPSRREDRSFVVNVQIGDESVVSPDVGVQSEKDVLVMSGEQVARVILVRPSSLAAPGQRVLSEAQLVLLGTTMARVEGPFKSHFDLGPHPADDVLVDFEFKFQNAQLFIKQARLFLIGDPFTAPVFQRGDVNVDGKTDLGDVVFTLCQLFGDGADPSCLKSADIDDSGELDIADPLLLLNHLFAGGSGPGSPVGACGVDPTDDDLSCEAFELCT